MQLFVLQTQLLQFEFAMSFFKTAACKFTIFLNLFKNSNRSLKDIEKKFKILPAWPSVTRNYYFKSLSIH